jgi:prepilin-type N-terminal cleavage/methylation domain-containing protein
MRDRQYQKKGFTLAEVLVTIAIIAVVGAIVIPSIGGQLRTGDESRVQQDLTSLRAAAEQFLADVRRYPNSIGQLVVKPAVSESGLLGGVYTASQVGRWRGPYLNKDSASSVKTGYDLTITTTFGFVNFPSTTQKYLTIDMASVDTGYARGVDRKMDDGVENAGMIQYTIAASPTTTLKFYALPVQ